MSVYQDVEPSAVVFLGASGLLWNYIPNIILLVFQIDWLL